MLSDGIDLDSVAGVVNTSVGRANGSNDEAVSAMMVVPSSVDTRESGVIKIVVTEGSSLSDGVGLDSEAGVIVKEEVSSSEVDVKSDPEVLAGVDVNAAAVVEVASWSAEMVVTAAHWADKAAFSEVEVATWVINGESGVLAVVVAGGPSKCDGIVCTLVDGVVTKSIGAVKGSVVEFSSVTFAVEVSSDKIVIVDIPDDDVLSMDSNVVLAFRIADVNITTMVELVVPAIVVAVVASSGMPSVVVAGGPPILADVVLGWLNSVVSTSVGAV